MMTRARAHFTCLLVMGVSLVILSRAHCEEKRPLPRAGQPQQVIIKGNTFIVEIADTPALQEQGLSDRALMPKDRGMLFIFPNQQIRTFWMRRMHFPLDIVWIADREIVRIDKNLPPEGETPQAYYSSGRAVNYVLELNGGIADKYKIRRGGKVIFK